jgi:superfamily I DNA and RNA helicase
MTTAAQNWLDRSSISMDRTRRNAMISALSRKGYDMNALKEMSNDEILELANFEGQAESDYLKNRTDRSDSMSDFRSQLASLNSAKQRQAEQAGRIQEGVQRTQGLAQMMSNF